MSSKNKNKQNKNNKPDTKTNQPKEAKKQNSNEDPLTVQNELLAKMAMLKQQLGQLKGQGDDGSGSEMIENLFSTLMGQMDKGGMNAKPVNRQEYIDSEQAHQESMADIDHTLESIRNFIAEIDNGFKKLFDNDFEGVADLVEEDTEILLSEKDEKALILTDNAYKELLLKKGTLEKKLEEQNRLIEEIGPDSVCNKYSNLLKDLNGIQKQKNWALMNYLRMKSQEGKK